MLAIDTLLLKISEEASEASLEVATIIKLANKAIRFGDASWHPKDPTKRTNEAMMLYGLQQLDEELHDLHATVYLYLYHKYQFTAQEAMVQSLASQWFPNAATLNHALRKLTKFDRLLIVTKQKETISAETLETLQASLTHAMNYLREQETRHVAL